jgi:hypothetical protein
MTIPLTVTGVRAVNDIIAGYLEAPNMSEFVIDLGMKEAFKMTNSLNGELVHALASKAKVRFEVRRDCGFYDEIEANIVASFPGKFLISRKCNCSDNWSNFHICQTQSDNWGHCNCTYSGGCQNLCTEETAVLRPKNVPFFRKWIVKDL